MLKVHTSQRQALSDVSIEMLSNAHEWVGGCVWGGFNQLTKQGSNHRISCCKEDSGIMNLFHYLFR